MLWLILLFKLDMGLFQTAVLRLSCISNLFMECYVPLQLSDYSVFVYIITLSEFKCIPHMYALVYGNIVENKTLKK